MISLRMMGGMGNQLFIFALGRSLERNDTVQYSIAEYQGEYGPRMYMLDQLGLNLNTTTKSISQIMVETGLPILNERNMRFDPTILNVKNVILNGYWQSEKYFERVELTIRNEIFPAGFYLSPESLKLSSQIRAMRNSAFIHVRRSDTLSKRAINFHGLTPLEYYNQATEYIRSRVPDVHFFIFSDDIDWCKANMSHLGTVASCNSPSFVLRPDNEPEKRVGGTEVQDLYLMHLCRHGILANSTFSWWAAWLNPLQTNRIIIAPKQWALSEQVDATDLIPESWVRL